MKKVFGFICIALLSICSLLFSACGDQYANMTIKVNETSITILLGETENNSKSVMATVSGSKTVCESLFISYNDSISITTKYLGDGVTQATIKATDICSTDVKVQSKENNKVTYFHVNVVKPVTSIALKSNAINYGVASGDINSTFVLTNNMFNFMPEGTSQNEVAFELENEQIGISIENNVLTVLNADVIQNIHIKAISTSKSSVSTSFVFTVFPKININKAVIDGTEYLATNLTDVEDVVLQFSKNNNENFTKNIELHIAKSEEYNLILSSFIAGDVVVVNNSRQNDSSDTIVYNVTLNASAVGLGAIRFYAEYEGYASTKSQLLSVNARTIEEIVGLNVFTETNENLLLPNNEGQYEVDVYSAYKETGLKFFFEAVPNPLNSLDKKIILNISNLEDKFVVYNSLGVQISGDEEGNVLLYSGENFIYIKSLANNIDNATMTLTSETYPDVKKDVVLKPLKGANEISFAIGEEEVDTIYLTSNERNSKVIKINSEPELSNLTGIMFEKTGDSFDYEFDNAKNELTISSIQEAIDQEGKIKVTLPNKVSAEIAVSVFKQMEEDKVIVSTSSTINSSSVGAYSKNIDNSVEKVAIKTGNTINLNIETNYANYENIQFSYIDCAMADFTANYFDDKTNYAENSNFVEAMFNNGNYYLNSKSAGITKVKVLISGYYLNEDNVKDIIEIEKNFLVEVYAPIETLELSTYKVDLYSADSLGYANVNLSKETIRAIINRTAEEPSKYSLEWLSTSAGSIWELQEDEEIEQQYTINAYEYDPRFSNFSIYLKATEMFNLFSTSGRIYYVSININISRAKQVEEITVNNVGEDGIYIDLTKNDTSKYFQILTTVAPIDALNKNLIFQFIPDAGYNSNILTIDDKGLITISDEKIGGKGYIRVIPQDGYSTEGVVTTSAVCPIIPIVLVDGLRKETSIRINSLSEINNSNLHYTLLSNAVYETQNEFLTNFNGGLYGALKNVDNNEKPTIELKNGLNLIDILGEKGIVDNFNIIGQGIINSGFVANENNGTISNVNIETILNDSYTFSSLVSTSDFAGAICGVNKGKVKDCEVYADIKCEGKTAGGVVGSNEGEIENCKVEFYIFDNDLENKILGANVGAIAGNNIGTIDNCDANVYYADEIRIVLDETTTENKIVAEGEGEVNNCHYNDIKIENDLLPNFENIKIQNTNNSIKEYAELVEENTVYYAIMFLYQESNVVLSAKERQVVKNWNTAVLNSIFDENMDNLRVTSSNNDVIKVYSNSIQMLSTGETTIRIFSKYNSSSSSKSINIKVIYPVIDFELTYLNTKIENNSNLKVKNGKEIVLQTKTENSKIAVDRYINYIVNQDLVVDFGDFLTQAKIGNHKVLISGEDNEIKNVNIILSSLVEDSYKKVIENGFNINFNIVVYKGAENISLNVSNVLLLPNESSTVLATILSDVASEDLLISVKDGSGNIEDNLGNKYSDIFEFNIVKIDEETLFNGYKNFNYEVEISVNDAFKSYKFFEYGYVLTFEAKSLENVSNGIKKFINLQVGSQNVTSISISHHYQTQGEGSNSYSQYSFESNNSLTPGSAGLLKISLYPTYAEYDYITIKSVPVNGKTISLRMLTKVGDRYTNADINLYTAIPNGLRIDKSIIDLHSNSENLGLFYIKTVVDKSIDLDVIFPLEITCYSNGEIVKADTFILNTKYLSRASLTVNGQENVSYIAKKTENTIEVRIPFDQTFTPTSVVIFPSEDAYITDWVETLYESKGYKTYTAKLNAGDQDLYTISAVVSWEINGKIESKTTQIDVYALDFILEQNKTQLLVDGVNKNTLNAFINVNSSLDFSFEVDYNPEIEEYYNAYMQFLNDNFYIESSDEFERQYIVNYYNGLNYVSCENNEKSNFLRNLYIRNGNQLTAVWNEQQKKAEENNIVSFEYVETTNKINAIGKSTGSLDMRFIMRVMMPNGIELAHEFDFTINVDVYTDEDTPRVITNAEEFLKIKDENEAQDYILMNDIVLNNYTPFDTTNINTLDGNNKTITIRNFLLPTQTSVSSIEFALFNNITQNTLLKNISINLNHLSEIYVNTDTITNIKIAGLGIRNSGYITNCEVIAYQKDGVSLLTPTKGIKVTYSSGNIYANISSITAGFVITNENKGSITNSRVGGETKTFVIDNKGTTNEITLNSFEITAQGNIAGFVYENNGLISSCYFNNSSITNSSTTDFTSITSGFVGLNNSGEINLSFAKGVFANSKEIHASYKGITSVGISAGFVYQNSAKVSNCYSNLRLSGSSLLARSSAGFVYNNLASGVISQCYSASQIEKFTTTQMNFSGVNENQEFLNKGVIENSYYYDQNVSRSLNNEVINPSVEEYYNTPAVRVDSITNKEAFYGFAFASNNNYDGCWTLTSKGPDLLSANTETISSRYIVQNEGEETYTLPYVAEFKYGSINNPILIRDAEEFNQVFGNSKRTPIQQYYDLNNKIAFGSYRLVSNIDFSSFAKETILNSSRMSLTQVVDASGLVTGAGILDGNGFSITNISFIAKMEIKDSFGLFKEINNNATVKNLNITLGKTDSTGNMYGISAGYVQTVGTLAGRIKDANLINIKVSALNENANVKVEGQNIVGGVVGQASGNLKIYNVTSENISVKALQTQVVEQYSREGQASIYSYAGGVFGVLDLYKSSNSLIVNVKKFDTDYTANIVKLKSSGKQTIEGAIVGGIVGFVGDNTHIQDCLYEISDSSYTQKLIAYNSGYAGGIAGVSNGLLNQCRSEHSLNIQVEIENQENIATYYSNISSIVDKGNETLFYNSNYSPKAIGGLVGLLGGTNGQIFCSYAKINVKNSKANYAGGLVGLLSSAKDVVECYATGDVLAKDNIGGIFGFVSVDNTIKISLNKVNALNYWSKNTNISKARAIAGNLGEINNFTCKDVYVASKIKIISGSNLIDANVSHGIGALYSAEVVDGDNSFSYLDDLSTMINKSKYIFRISDEKWNNQKWALENNKYFADMKFIISTDTYYINVAEDILLMNMHPTATFIITRMVDCDAFSTNYKNFMVLSFSGILKGKDEFGTYGFDNLNLSNPLFNIATGASFNSFTIRNSKKINMDSSAYFINQAQSIILNAIKIDGISVKASNNTDFAILAKTIKNGISTIESSEFINCQINIEEKEQAKINAGIICATQTGNLILKDNIIKSNTINYSSENTNDIYTNVNLAVISGNSEGTIDLCVSTTSDEILENTYIQGNSINILTENSVNELYAGIISGTGAMITYSNVPFTNNKILSQNKTKNVDKLYLGLFAGQTNILSLNNFTLDKTNFIEVRTNNEQAKSELFIGGLVAKSQAITGKFVSINASINILSTNLTSLNQCIVGGLVAILDPSLAISQITSIENSYFTVNSSININLFDNSKCNNLYIGGAVGIINQNDDYFANIQNIITNNVVTLNCNNFVTNTTIIGGIVGDSQDNESLIDTCIAYGDLIMKNMKFSSTSIPDGIYIGGIVGQTKKIPNSCLSLFTVDKQGIVKEYSSIDNFNLYAIVGNYLGETISPLLSDKINKYVHQITLSVDDEKFAENHKYIEAKNIFDELFTGTNEIIIPGEKISPITTNSLENLQHKNQLVKTYYCFNTNTNTYIWNPTDDSIVLNDNVVIIGDGTLIEQENIGITLDDNFALFETINSNNIISGFSVQTNYFNLRAKEGNYSPLGILANKNEGIIYATNVTTTDYLEYVKLTDSSQVGGIVGTNNGLIDTCYVNLFIKNGGKVCGLAHTNNGVIIDCFTTGAIMEANTSFALSNGILISCYSNMQVQNYNKKEDTKGSFAENTTKNCYYDYKALQIEEEVEEEGKEIRSLDTNEMSLNYMSSNSTNVNNKIMQKLPTSKYVWECNDNKVNYGYPIFNAEVYNCFNNSEDKNYMNIALQTGDGTELKYFLIPSIGKLEQVSSNSSANYKLINDIDGNLEMVQPYNNAGSRITRYERVFYKFNSIGNFSGYFTGARDITVQSTDADNVTYGTEFVISNMQLTTPIFMEISGKVKYLGLSGNFNIYNETDSTQNKFSILSTSLNDEAQVTNINVNANIIGIDVNSENSGNYYAGIITATMNGNSKIDNCYINGAIIISAKIDGNVMIGGISGISTGNNEITNCFNSARIDVDGNDNLNYYVGGILGKCESPSPKFTLIDKCANHGEVVTGNKEVNWSSAAGICAWAERANIEYCMNDGNITANAKEQLIENIEDNQGHKVDKSKFVVSFKDVDLKIKAKELTAKKQTVQETWEFTIAEGFHNDITINYDFYKKDAYANGIAYKPESIINCFSDSSASTLNSAISGGYNIFRPSKIIVKGSMSLSLLMSLLAFTIATAVTIVLSCCGVPAWMLYLTGALGGMAGIASVLSATLFPQIATYDSVEEKWNDDASLEAILFAYSTISNHQFDFTNIEIGLMVNNMNLENADLPIHREGKDIFSGPEQMFLNAKFDAISTDCDTCIESYATKDSWSINNINCNEINNLKLKNTLHFKNKIDHRTIFDYYTKSYISLVEYDDDNNTIGVLEIDPYQFKIANDADGNEYCYYVDSVQSVLDGESYKLDNNKVILDAEIESKMPKSLALMQDSNNNYKIENLLDFNKFIELITKDENKEEWQKQNYILLNDINILYNDNTGMYSNLNFSGTFDGQYNTINALGIANNQVEQNYGLFANLVGESENRAQVKNIKFRNLKFDAKKKDALSTNVFVGILAGNAQNADIDNISILTSNVTSKDLNTALLVGNANNAKITNCKMSSIFANVYSTINTDDLLQNFLFFGGVVVKAENSQITNNSINNTSTIDIQVINEDKTVTKTELYGFGIIADAQNVDCHSNIFEAKMTIGTPIYRLEDISTENYYWFIPPKIAKGYSYDINSINECMNISAYQVIDWQNSDELFSKVNGLANIGETHNYHIYTSQKVEQKTNNALVNGQSSQTPIIKKTTDIQLVNSTIVPIEKDSLKNNSGYTDNEDLDKEYLYVVNITIVDFVVEEIYTNDTTEEYLINIYRKSTKQWFMTLSNYDFIDGKTKEEFVNNWVSNPSYVTSELNKLTLLDKAYGIVSVIEDNQLKYLVQDEENVELSINSVKNKYFYTENNQETSLISKTVSTINPVEFAISEEIIYGLNAHFNTASTELINDNDKKIVVINSSLESMTFNFKNNYLEITAKENIKKEIYKETLLNLERYYISDSGNVEIEIANKITSSIETTTNEDTIVEKFNDILELEGENELSIQEIKNYLLNSKQTNLYSSILSNDRVTQSTNSNLWKNEADFLKDNYENIYDKDIFTSSINRYVVKDENADEIYYYTISQSNDRKNYKDYVFKYENNESKYLGYITYKTIGNTAYNNGNSLAYDFDSSNIDISGKDTSEIPVIYYCTYAKLIFGDTTLLVRKTQKILNATANSSTLELELNTPKYAYLNGDEWEDFKNENEKLKLGNSLYFVKDENFAIAVVSSSASGNITTLYNHNFEAEKSIIEIINGYYSQIIDGEDVYDIHLQENDIAGSIRLPDTSEYEINATEFTDSYDLLLNGVTTNKELKLNRIDGYIVSIEVKNN